LCGCLFCPPGHRDQSSPNVVAPNFNAERGGASRTMRFNSLRVGSLVDQTFLRSMFCAQELSPLLVLIDSIFRSFFLLLTHLRRVKSRVPKGLQRLHVFLARTSFQPGYSPLRHTFISATSSGLFFYSVWYKFDCPPFSQVTYQTVFPPHSALPLASFFSPSALTDKAAFIPYFLRNSPLFHEFPPLVEN